MCDTRSRAEVTPAEALPASLEWKGEVLTHAIARRLPGAFIQNSVGTTFHLTAAAV